MYDVNEILNRLMACPTSDIARKTGIHITTISRIKHRKIKNPSAESFLKLVKYLDEYEGK